MSLQTSQASDLSQGDKQGPSDQKRKKVHKRTRTGCTTCRARKMKCDEVKPICGNCSKSRRDCRWHDLTFRHDQNASVNESKNSQSKFYRGSGTFTPEQRRSFVPVSNDIQFTPTLSATAPLNMQPRPMRTPIEDRHLQALAATAAAAQYPQYTPPQGSYPTYTEAAQASQTAQMAQFTPNNPNINALLNPTRTPTSMIDPSLETPSSQTNTSAENTARDGETSRDVEDTTKTEEDETNETDTKLAHALQGFSDGKGKESDGAEGPG